MDKREELIEYLETHCTDQYGELCTWMVADFIIIQDRKRIVAPLINNIDWYSKNSSGMEWRDIVAAQKLAMESSINLAGASHGE